MIVNTKKKMEIIAREKPKKKTTNSHLKKKSILL